MNEMGHTDPALTLAVYTAEMSRDDGEKACSRGARRRRRPGSGRGVSYAARSRAPGASSVEAVRHPENALRTS